MSEAVELEPTDAEFFDAVVGWLSARDMIDRQDALDGLTVADVIAALDEHENGMAAALNHGEGEPVAWLGTTVDGWSDVTLNADNISVWKGYGRHVQPLYTRPVAWPEGFKLVPVEPTEAMRRAAGPLYSLAAWTAMLRASDGAGQVGEEG